jgi:thiol-disulfide isomerase/thioredoxin
MSISPFPERQKPPPFPEGLTWMNTAGPLELSDLGGKFVILDFWTYCCINCMHILPELEKLEKKYPNNLVVIGVHSAKFEGERDTENITEAILRYHIAHPVINDADHLMWNRFRVQAWPTVMLIDPEGYVVWGVRGEITFEQVDEVLGKAVPFYRKMKLLDETPLRFELEAYRRDPTPLRFPGKVLADASGDRLFIADSGHNRIVVTRLDGTLVDVIGSGAIGRADGPAATAEFNDPQGMALRGDALWVADTKNHTIRRVDLTRREVTTEAGLGYQSRTRATSGMANPKKTALASPWALWIHQDDLYIAMAGRHQIWRMRLNGSGIGPYAGNLREDIVDGPLLPREAYQLGYASFAQPSGLASDGEWLYVADSEGSSIRAVPFNPRGSVRTVVGTSHLQEGRLFTFGDVDGPPRTARLQHALGIVYDQGRLFVADTYNNKIKTVAASDGTTRTLAGTGQPGRDDQPAQFDEPAGISLANGKLYVADTNNHLIRVVDLEGENRVRTLSLPGLQPPKPPREEKEAPADVETKLAAVAVRAVDGTLRLRVELDLPGGYKINPAAPLSYRVDAVSSGDEAGSGPVGAASLGRRTRVEPPAAAFEVSLPIDSNSGRQTLQVSVTYYYCRTGAEGICKVGTVAWTVPVELSADAEGDAVVLKHQVQ